MFLSLIRPAYGGRDCPGSAFDYQMCNTEECAGPYEDFRAQQCVQRSNKYHKNIKHTWLPYEHPDGKSWLSASLVSLKVFCTAARGQMVVALAAFHRNIKSHGGVIRLSELADVFITFDNQGVYECVFMCFQRPVNVSWAVSQRKRERWYLWTRWCMMGLDAAT